MKIIWWWWSHPYYFAHDYHPICLSIPATFLGGFNGVTRFWAIWPSRHQGKVRSNSAWEGVFMDFGGFSLIRWDSQKPFVGSALSRSEEGGRPDHPGGACDGYAKVGGGTVGNLFDSGEIYKWLSLAHQTSCWAFTTSPGSPWHRSKFARRQRLPLVTLLTATWAMAAFCYQMTFIEEVAEPVAEVRAKSCPPVLNLCFLK